ncbi:MAG: zinc/manganese transport system permease protein [Rhodothermales bacterium]|jgi:zinc/manganese transport system permease protein
MADLLALEFVQYALVASIVMGLMLAYLGVHVVERGIVFVDLALGQISMLGVAAAAYLELNPTVVSIVFTLVGAFLLSLIKVSDARLKVEAVIGIVYAVASALTVLLISKAAHGDSDIQEVLFGSLFTVTSSRLLWMIVVFGALGVVHWVFRRQFFELTRRQVNHEAVRGGFDVWNFLFYVSIGLTIVLAVAVGGVIPVFSYLVVPAVAAILIAKRDAAVVILAMVLASVASGLGILLSVGFDLPAGPAIVSVLGVLCAGAFVVRAMQTR